MDRKICEICKDADAVVSGPKKGGGRISVCNTCLKKKGRFVFIRVGEENKNVPN